MSDEVSAAFEAIRFTLETLKTALSLTKDAKDLMPDSEEKQKADEAIALAVSSADQATALLAQQLDFKVCKCTFPGTPMLLDHRDKWGNEIVKCPKCGDEDPPEGPPPEELTMRIS